MSGTVNRPRFRELAPHTLRELADRLEAKEIKSLMVTWLNTDNGSVEHCWTIGSDDAVEMIGALELSQRWVMRDRIETSEDDA